MRLRKNLVDERTAWQQRIRAALFHHGVPKQPALLTAEGRAHLESADLPASARTALDTALRMIDRINDKLVPLERELRSMARRQRGCRALQSQFGVGP